MKRIRQPRTMKMNFQIQVANGQIEKPIATTRLKVDIGDNTFAAHFVVMRNLTRPNKGLHFMRHNCVVIDTTHGVIHFPHLTIQAKIAVSKASAKPQPVLIHNNTTNPPMKTKTITAFVCYPSEMLTIGTVTPVGDFTEAASVLISHSISTIIDKHSAVKVTNTTESPCFNQNKYTNFTPEQSKLIKIVETTVFSMIPEGYPDPFIYLNELLRTSKLEQQNNTFWFSTAKNFGKTENQTPIQSRDFRELREMQEKEKLNPKNDVESLMKLLQLSEWTNTLLTESEKHAVEEVLVENLDVFSRHRMDNGMNAEFIKRLITKFDKAVYNQSLPMLIHLKGDLNVELTLMHRLGIFTVLPTSK